MPEPVSLPPEEKELMYSPPPPVHNLRWYGEHFLRLLVMLAGMGLIAVLAFGLTILLGVLMRLLFPPVAFPFH
jgi:hypothetical protein